MEAGLLDDFQLEGPDPISDISYKYIEMNANLQYIEKPVKVEDFKDNMNKRNFEYEFNILRRLTENHMHAQCLKEYNPEIAKLNRYTSIIPCTSINQWFLSYSVLQSNILSLNFRAKIQR